MESKSLDLPVSVVHGLEAIDIFADWNCGQISALVAGVLALLPDEKDIFGGPALADRLGNSPAQKARLSLAHSLGNARTLLQGIKSNSDDLHNQIDLATERLRDEFNIMTPEKLETLAAVAGRSTTH